MINILWEDEHYLVADKPSGLFSHPHPFHMQESKDCVLFRVRDYLEQHVYLINRLDRPVSGIILLAKKPEYVSSFQDIWNTQKVRKIYHTVARGIFHQPGSFNFDLKGKNESKLPAQTDFKVEETYAHFTLLKVQIHTGRHHQIRRHFSRRCYNILGDTVYGKGKINAFAKKHFDLNRIFLHSSELIFEHPMEGHNIAISSPLPEDLLYALSCMKENNWKKEFLEQISPNIQDHNYPA